MLDIINMWDNVISTLPRPVRAQGAARGLVAGVWVPRTRLRDGPLIFTRTKLIYYTNTFLFTSNKVIYLTDPFMHLEYELKDKVLPL